MNQIHLCLSSAVSAHPTQAFLQHVNGRVRAVFLPPPRKAPATVAATTSAPVATPAPHKEKPVETPDARAWRELCNDLNRLSRSTNVQGDVAQLILDIRDAATLSDAARSKMLTRVERFVCLKMQQQFLEEENRPLTEASSLAILHDARTWMDGVLDSNKPKAEPKAKSDPAPKPRSAPKPRGFTSPEAALGFLTRPHLVLRSNGGGILEAVKNGTHLELVSAA